jgi:VWFA-related protein
VAVLLSDGRDEAASGLEPGSFHTLEEAIKAAHDKDVVVFTIGFGHHLDEEPDFTGRYTTEEILMRLASSTGGRYLEVRSSRALERAFRDIMEELRHQYQIAYVPPKPLPGQTWREIRVEVDRPEAEVRTRDGYYVK